MTSTAKGGGVDGEAGEDTFQAQGRMPYRLQAKHPMDNHHRNRCKDGWRGNRE